MIIPAAKLHLFIAFIVANGQNVYVFYGKISKKQVASHQSFVILRPEGNSKVGVEAMLLACIRSIETRMELRLIDNDFADGDRLYSIYEEAFPDNERIPTDEFLDVVRNYGCTPWAIFCGDKMIGFTCVMHSDEYKMGYIWYFAIAADCRNRGYGGKALRLLQDAYADSQLVLDMERLDFDARNYAQRISRLHFYERNGFERAYVGMSYFGMDYELMCSPTPFRLDDFKVMVAKAASSLFHPVFSLLAPQTVLFLHGFFASGQCIPAIALKEGLAGKADVLAPDLPLHPKNAMAFIGNLCDEAKPNLLVGNSCGSFYAQQIANEKCIPALLGNPHFEMTKFLRSRIGTHQYKSQRKDGKQDFTIDDQLIGEFAEMENRQFANSREDFKDKVWGLFGDSDSLAHYEPMFLEHYTHSYHFPGGHTPTAEEVKIWYVPLVERMLH